MKVKIKITGFEGGRLKSFQQTVETPNFHERTCEFMGHCLTYSVEDQQSTWIDDNYDEIVVRPAEARFLHPIMGYKIVKERVNKKKLVESLLIEIFKGKDEFFKAMFMGTLWKLWPTIRGNSPIKIIEITLASMDATDVIASGILADISSAFHPTVNKVESGE